MKAIKLVTGTTYFLSWGVCLLPNASTTGHAYDEPQDDVIISKIIETSTSDDIVDTTCDGYTHNVIRRVDLEDLLNVKTLNDDLKIPYNPDDYDSGDYGDY